MVLRCDCTSSIHSPSSRSALFIKYYFPFNKFELIRVVKSVRQSCDVPPEILHMLETFRMMVNDCIRIGLQHDASTLKRLAMLSYCQLARYRILSQYKKAAISRAAAILSNRKKSIRRGHQTKNPCMMKPILASYRGFKIDSDNFGIPIGNNQYYRIPLNRYLKLILMCDPTISLRSFTLTPSSISISYSKDVDEMECYGMVGIDRNLKNITVGNINEVIQYDLSKAADIAENTRSIMRSFRRNDARIVRNLASKYGRRRNNRVKQLLHKVSKFVVQKAKQEKTALVFEDIRHIRSMYQRGNYQNKSFRAKMNSWDFSEIKRQMQYKAKAEGLPSIQLTGEQTRGTSSLCPQCGTRTQAAARGDVWHQRQLWCEQCQRWCDRDVIAAMNLSLRGLLQFSSPQGAASEAMLLGIGYFRPIIRRVDAAKLNSRKLVVHCGFSRTTIV